MVINKLLHTDDETMLTVTLTPNEVNEIANGLRDAVTKLPATTYAKISAKCDALQDLVNQGNISYDTAKTLYHSLNLHP